MVAGDEGGDRGDAGDEGGDAAGGSWTADDDGWLERVIREGCPFFVGIERVFFCWERGSLVGR